MRRRRSMDMDEHWLRLLSVSATTGHPALARAAAVSASLAAAAVSAAASATAPISRLEHRARVW